MAGKILYLSWSVPPDTSGSAIIALNLAKQFTRDEMIVAGEKPCGKPPVRWDPRWPELAYVQYAWPVTGRGKRWWRMLQFPLMICKCLWLMRRHGVDRIVVVFPRGQFLFAGYLLARMTGCRLYAYLHNFYFNRTGVAYRFTAWVHRCVFRRAKHIFVMSEGMSEVLQRQLPELEATPLVHSFNEAIPEYEEPSQIGSPMRLIFCGNLVSCHDAAGRFAEAIARLRDASLSILSGDDPATLRQFGVLRPGTTFETVSRDEIPKRLKQADVVLLPHIFQYPAKAGDEYRTIFPTKTIEYLISGRPILAHSPADSFLTKFLVENDCALVVDRPDVDALCEAIERLRTDTDLRSRLVRNALRAAERFQAARVAAEFRKWVENSNGAVAPDAMANARLSVK